MKEKKITIPNVHCQHCVMTIKRELSEIDGIKDVDVEIDTKQLTVTWDPRTTWEVISHTLSEIGYPPE
jgi:copper chaperone